MTPTIRTALTHVGTAVGAAVATALFLASSAVDIYAIIDQLNVVVVEISKLVALVTPIVTGAYGVWKATTKSKLEDIEKDKRVEGVVVSDPKLAGQLGDKVQTSIALLPEQAKTAPSSRMAFIG